MLSPQHRQGIGARCLRAYPNRCLQPAKKPDNRHFRDYPLTGHAADMPKSTRMTQGGPSHRSSSSTSKLFSEAMAGKRAFITDEAVRLFCEGYRLPHTSSLTSAADSPSSSAGTGMVTGLGAICFRDAGVAYFPSGAENIELPLAESEAGTSSCITSQCSATLPPSILNISTTITGFGPHPT
jgi:hypothetical protein